MTAASQVARSDVSGRPRRLAWRSAPRIAPFATILLLGACASAPPPPPVVTPPAPVVTRDEKIAWIVRLEDQRLLRDPAAASATPNVAPGPPAAAAPAPVPVPPSDLVRLLADEDAVVRARAALALGRVGMPDAVPALRERLADERVDVRESAAFALGLIGDVAAVPALLAALGDAAPAVQGRAAEALGLIGARGEAPAIAAMMRPHIAAGALQGLEPDDLSHPLGAATEAVRLGLFALTRLGAYEPLASVVLAGGAPVSRWWPVAYALQRVNDPRAIPALIGLLDTPGRFTAAFAVKGLATRSSAEAATPLLRLVESRQAHPAVVMQAIRSLAASNARAAIPVLITLLGASDTDAALRMEVMTAFAALAGREHVDILLDLLSHRTASIRADAMRALARVDPDAFLATLASLDADAEWTVRAAQAQALGMLPADRAAPRLLAMLTDSDVRVMPAVLAAIAAARLPEAERLVAERLTAADFAVRGAAATALADLKAAGRVPELVQAYRAARDEPAYSARGAVLAAVHRLDPAAARPLLTEALQDRDWAIRVRASALLRESGVEAAAAQPQRPAAAGRPVDDPEWRRIVSPPFTPRAFIETSRGTIEIELDVVETPLTTSNFIALARRGFFANARIHRVVPDFVVQDGDPRGDGEGGPGYTIRDELSVRPYLRGTVGMALDWEDTGGSQFFITHSPQPHLDARYTAFGRVVEGMDVVDRLLPTDVIREVRIRDGVGEQ